MRLLKCWVVGVALCLGAVMVYAGPHEDALEAGQRSDYLSAAKLLRRAAGQGDAIAQPPLTLPGRAPVEQARIGRQLAGSPPSPERLASNQANRQLGFYVLSVDGRTDRA